MGEIPRLSNNFLKNPRSHHHHQLRHHPSLSVPRGRARFEKRDCAPAPLSIEHCGKTGHRGTWQRISDVTS